MRDILQKVLYGLGFYLFAMIVVSGISFLFPSEPKEQVITNSSIQSDDSIGYSEQIQIVLLMQSFEDDKQTIAETDNSVIVESAKMPFSMIINTTMEKREMDLRQTSSIPIADLSRFNILEELENRKRKCKYNIENNESI